MILRLSSVGTKFSPDCTYAMGRPVDTMTRLTSRITTWIIRNRPAQLIPKVACRLKAVSRLEGERPDDDPLDPFGNVGAQRARITFSPSRCISSN